MSLFSTQKSRDVVICSGRSVSKYWKTSSLLIRSSKICNSPNPKQGRFLEKLKITVTKTQVSFLEVNPAEQSYLAFRESLKSTQNK